MENISVSEPRFGRFDLRSLIGFVISGVLLWLTLKKSGLRIGDIKLSAAQWGYFVTAIAIFVFSLSLYAQRAKLIWVDKTKKTPPVFTYSSLIIGNFYNSILPGNLGDGIRAWHFSRKNHVFFSRSLAAIITEKWLDAQVFAVFVIVLFIIKPFTNNYILYALAFTAFAVIVLSIVHAAMLLNRKIEKRLWCVALWFKKAGRFLYRTYIYTNWHLANMRKNKVIAGYIVYFILIFILNVLQFFFLQKAAGVTGPVGGLYSSFLVSLSMMIIAFIPSAPGNIGVIHYGVYSVLILAARQYGIEPDGPGLESYALFAIYVHLSFFIPEVLLGALFLVKERRTLFIHSQA